MGDREKIVNCTHAPQFEDLDSIKLSFYPPSIWTITTNDSGRTFEFSRFIGATQAFTRCDTWEQTSAPCAWLKG